MIVLKQGKIPGKTKQFYCINCGCIFDAEQGKYSASSYLEVMHGGAADYKCVCPCCKR